MFTGSVVEGLGRFHIFYTGDNGANPRGTEFIMHATSPDLIHWTKHPEDMIAPDGIHYKNARSRDFRDPYVFWNAAREVLLDGIFRATTPRRARECKGWPFPRI